MARRALHIGVLGLVFLCRAGDSAGQGRDPKVYYDHEISAGSQQLVRLPTTYFELLTTPAPEDPNGDVLRHWAPRVDRLFENVTGNLHLTRGEVYRYLLFPGFFSELDKLVIERRLARADFDAVLQEVTAAGDSGISRPARPLVFLSPPDAGRRAEVRSRQYGDHTVVRGDSVFVRWPEPAERALQRCVLYRTLSDFMATPIGPNLPEGVLGFVPRHDPARPVVIYASLGENRLRRTAQHEIGHAVVEGISAYIRSLSVTRMLHAPRDTSKSKAWKPASGGFAAVTHENYAEYLAFPHGVMDPALHAALVEMVSDNSVDGLAAMSVGARTLASSYVEGPARLTFLAETFGEDLPKRLLVDYYEGTGGLLDQLETLTGHTIPELEGLYQRWLRERFWREHLTTAVPDTLGHVIASGWSGVRRDGTTLVTRAREGRQEVAVISPPAGPRRKPRAQIAARDLDGAERLPLFSTSDLRHGRVVTVARNRNVESLLFTDLKSGRRWRCALGTLGAVREIRDPRWSADGKAVVCRVVDRAGRDAIAVVQVESGAAELVVPWQWAEVANPIFADGDAAIVYTSTATPDRTADLRLLDLATRRTTDLTRTDGINETEPTILDGHLLCLADEPGVPAPYVLEPMPDPSAHVACNAPGIGSRRRLLNLPFSIDHIAAGDSGLVLVANSLRHRALPASRALWEFDRRRLGLPDAAAGQVADLSLPGEARASIDDATAAFDADTHRAVMARARGSNVEELLAAATASAEANRTTRAALRPWLASGEPVSVTAYRQKWHLMPLGLNMTGGTGRGRGIGFFGFDTEFHDQQVMIAAGQTGKFDRFGLLQYRNRTARTHWQAAGFHRSVVRRRYTADPIRVDSAPVIDRQESEQGLLLSAQYHQSLITRFGLGVSVARRSDGIGRVETPAEETLRVPLEVPALELQLAGLRPRSWNTTIFGVQRLAMLQDRSPAALDAWRDAVAQAKQDERFVVESEYVRPAFGIGTSFSRDTRTWADYRGPHSGSLLVLDIAGGVHAHGTTTLKNAAGGDSLQSQRSSGLERLSGSWLFVTHRRAAFVDLAMRCRGLLNSGPQALIYGLGGISTVAGYPAALVRSPRVAWTNTEARVQLWDYSAWRLPVRGLVIPAADGFVFADAGVARGTEPLYSYGIGLRMRLGFLAFEWRKSLRAGQVDQRGLTLVW